MDQWLLDHLSWILPCTIGGAFTGVVWLIRLDSKVRYLAKRDKEKTNLLERIDQNLQTIREQIAVILDRQDRGDPKKV